MSEKINSNKMAAIMKTTYLNQTKTKEKRKDIPI